MKKAILDHDGDNQVFINEEGAIMVCHLCGANLELGECSEEGEWYLNCPDYEVEIEKDHTSVLVKYAPAE